MARTIKSKEEPKPGTLRYRKVGKGLMHFQHRILREGMVIQCRPEDIPNAFRKFFTCLDPEEEIRVKEQGRKEVEKLVQYEIRKATANGWFNVVNVETGKKINGVSLRRAQAEEMMSAVNK
jgi:hypothetical protein